MLYDTWIWYGDSGQLGWPAPRICSLIRVLFDLQDVTTKKSRMWVGALRLKT